MTTELMPEPSIRHILTAKEKVIIEISEEERIDVKATLLYMCNLTDYFRARLRESEEERKRLHAKIDIKEYLERHGNSNNAG